MPYSCIVNPTEWRALSAPLSIFTSPQDILPDHSGGLCIVYSLMVSLWSAFFSWLVCWMLFRVSFLCSQLPVFFANPLSSTFFYLGVFLYLSLYPIMCNFVGSHCGVQSLFEVSIYRAATVLGDGVTSPRAVSGLMWMRIADCRLADSRNTECLRKTYSPIP